MKKHAKSVEWENLEEDLEFARRTEEACIKYGKWEFKSMSKDEFLADLEKW